MGAVDSTLLSEMSSKSAFELFQWSKQKQKYDQLRIHIIHKKTTSRLH